MGRKRRGADDPSEIATASRHPDPLRRVRFERRRRQRRGRCYRTYVRCRSLVHTELHAHSAFSFLDGASAPEELAEQAATLGYGQIALTDHDGLCGSLAFATACRDAGIRAITGAELTFAAPWEGAHLTLLCETAQGYANLCRLITLAHAHTRDAPRPSGGPAGARTRSTCAPTPRGSSA